MTCAARSREDALRRFLTEVCGVEPEAPRSLSEKYRRYSDTFELEGLIHEIPKDQLEVMICLHFGMPTDEIVRVLGYPNVVRYYNVSAKLRKVYLEQKGKYLRYN